MNLTGSLAPGSFVLFGGGRVTSGILEVTNWCGYPFIHSALQTKTSSFFLSSSVEQCVNAFLSRMDTTDDLYALGWWDAKCRYWSVCVGFLYVDVDRDPSCWCAI